MRIPDRDEYRRQWAALEMKDRRRIVKAVNRGQALERRRDAALAVMTARSQRRFWTRAWLLGPLAALLAATSGWAAYLANALIATAIIGLMSWFWLRRIDRAEQANLDVAGGKKPPKPSKGASGKRSRNKGSSGSKGSPDADGGHTPRRKR